MSLQAFTQLTDMLTGRCHQPGRSIQLMPQPIMVSPGRTLIILPRMLVLTTPTLHLK